MPHARVRFLGKTHLHEPIEAADMECAPRSSLNVERVQANIHDALSSESLDFPIQARPALLCDLTDERGFDVALGTLAEPLGGELRCSLPHAARDVLVR
jgi:hypothetical protein